MKNVKSFLNPTPFWFHRFSKKFHYPLFYESRFLKVPKLTVPCNNAWGGKRKLHTKEKEIQTEEGLCEVWKWYQNYENYRITTFFNKNCLSVLWIMLSKYVWPLFNNMLESKSVHNFFRGSRLEVIYKIMAPKIFCKIFLSVQLYYKRDSGTGVLQWILKNF